MDHSLKCFEDTLPSAPEKSNDNDNDDTAIPTYLLYKMEHISSTIVPASTFPLGLLYVRGVRSARSQLQPEPPTACRELVSMAGSNSRFIECIYISPTLIDMSQLFDLINIKAHELLLNECQGFRTGHGCEAYKTSCEASFCPSFSHARLFGWSAARCSPYSCQEHLCSLRAEAFTF